MYVKIICFPLYGYGKQRLFKYIDIGATVNSTLTLAQSKFVAFSSFKTVVHDFETFETRPRQGVYGLRVRFKTVQGQSKTT